MLQADKERSLLLLLDRINFRTVVDARQIPGINREIASADLVLKISVQTVRVVLSLRTWKSFLLLFTDCRLPSLQRK